MAVVSGLASKDKYPALTKVLKKEYHASPYMEKYVLEGPFPRWASRRLPWNGMKQRYTRMLDYAEYTTLFEGWGIGAEGFGAARVNHAWSGARLPIESEGLRYRANRLPASVPLKIAPRIGSLSQKPWPA